MLCWHLWSILRGVIIWPVLRGASILLIVIKVGGIEYEGVVCENVLRMRVVWRGSV